MIGSILMIVLLAAAWYKMRELADIAQQMNNDQKEEARHAIAKKITEIQSSYPLGSTLVRGQTLCPDGCDVDYMVHGDFLLVIIDGEVRIKSRQDYSTRKIELPNCPNKHITKFGIDLDGRVFARRISGFIGRDPVEHNYTVEYDCVAVLLEMTGRLKYLK